MCQDAIIDIAGHVIFINFLWIAPRTSDKATSGPRRSLNSCGQIDTPCCADTVNVKLSIIHIPTCCSSGGFFSLSLSLALCVCACVCVFVALRCVELSQETCFFRLEASLGFDFYDKNGILTLEGFGIIGIFVGQAEWRSWCREEMEWGRDCKGLQDFWAQYGLNMDQSWIRCYVVCCDSFFASAVSVVEFQREVSVVEWTPACCRCASKCRSQMDLWGFLGWCRDWTCSL